MSVYVRCKAKREAPVPKSRENMLLKQRQVSKKVNFLLICLSEKCYFCVGLFRRYVLCEKWVGSICILVTMGRKNLSLSVITFISAVRINEFKTVSSLLRPSGGGYGWNPRDTNTGNERWEWKLRFPLTFLVTPPIPWHVSTCSKNSAENTVFAHVAYI